MQYTQHAHHVAGSVIDEDVILVRYQLTSVGSTAKLAQAGMIDQAVHLSANSSSMASTAAGLSATTRTR